MLNKLYKKIADKALSRITGKDLMKGCAEYVPEFESIIKSKLKVEYALFLNSGTAALHAGLVGIGISKDNEVIVPNFTFAASALSVVACSAKPVFCKVDYKQGVMDPEDIESRITSKTKAIMPVHINGYVCDMVKIKDIASRYDLKIIEDACQAFGSIQDKRYAGTIGNVGCFSLQESKQIRAGEGGILVTDSKECYDRAKLLMKFGDSGVTSLNYESTTMGYNYKANAVSIIVAIEGLKEMDNIIEERRKIYLKLQDKANLTYKLKDESPWRACVIGDSNLDLRQNSGKWCQKPLTEHKLFEGSIKTGDEARLKQYLSTLNWYTIG